MTDISDKALDALVAELRACEADEAADAIIVLRANIDLKADFIEATLNTAATDHQKIGELIAENAALREKLSTAERDAYARGVDDAARVVDTAGDGAVTEALSAQLCCNGHHCGCQGADVGSYLQHIIRAMKGGAE